MHKLDCGFTVIVVPKGDVPVAFCSLAYRGGSAGDPPGLEGLTDFVRRLSFHGTEQLGTKDPVAEETLRNNIEMTLRSRDQLLTNLPKDIFNKLSALPREIQNTQDRIQNQLKALAAQNLPPMSRQEMEELLAFIRSQEARLEKMHAQIQSIRNTPHYASFDRVRVLEAKLQNDSRSLAELLLPDPIRSAFRAGGAIEHTSFLLHDATLFEAVLPANRVELFLWIESKRAADAVFRYFNREKSLASLAADDQNRNPAFTGILHQLTFADHPYGRPKQGTSQTLGSITTDLAQRHYERIYAPQRGTLTIVGDLDPDRVFYLAKRYFGEMKPKTEPDPPGPPPSPAGPLHMVRFGRSTSVELRSLLPPPRHADFPALEAFCAYLELRTDLGSSFADAPPSASFMDVRLQRGAHGSLLILKAFPTKTISPFRLSHALQDQLKKISAETPSEEDLKRAKALWRARARERLENPRFLARHLAVASSQGNWKIILPSALDKETPQSVGKAARTHIMNTTPQEILTEVVE
ncbi:MAG: M16 family metallopeptidase [Planctomycetota bacterium]